MEKPRVQISPEERQERFDNLTKRQVDVLFWRKNNKNPKEIGQILGKTPEDPLDEKTISSHITAIFDTLLPELPAEPPQIRKDWGDFFLEIYYYPIFDEKNIKTGEDLKNYRPPKRSRMDRYIETSGDISGEKSGVEEPTIGAQPSQHETSPDATHEEKPKEEIQPNQTPPDDQHGRSEPPGNRRLSFQEIASNRTFQAVVALLVITWIVVLIVIISSSNHKQTPGQPTQNLASNAAVEQALAPSITNISILTLTPTTTDTPTITPTFTATPTWTPTLTPTPTWTPLPTQEVMVDTTFANGVEPWDISGPYVIQDGSITWDGSHPVIMSVGDSGWKNYRVTISFTSIDTGMCDIFMGVRVNDENKGMWLGIAGTGSLGWFNGARGYSSWISGNSSPVEGNTPIVEIKVTGNTFNWIGGTSVTVEGHPTGGVQIYFKCNRIDHIKIIKLP